MEIRIEYAIPTASGSWRNCVIFAESFEVADSICEKIDEYGYRLIDVSNFIEEE